MDGNNQMIYDLYVDEDGDMALGVGDEATYVYCQDHGREGANEDHYVELGDFPEHWANAVEQDELWEVKAMYHTHQVCKQFTGTLEQCYNIIDKVKGYL